MGAAVAPRPAIRFAHDHQAGIAARRRRAGQARHAAMTAAGWTLAGPVNLRTSWRIVVSSVLGRFYPEAPVSPLHLFGHKQDLAYQQEVEGSPSQRHQVRFWRVPDGWPLPGGRRVGLLGAGIFDTAVGLSLFTLQCTHLIDEDIDVERDHIVDPVSSAPGIGDRVSVDVIREFSSGYHHRNGGGDRVRTDGDLPVIDLRRVPATLDDGHPAAVRAAASGFAMPEGPSASPDADWRGGGTSAGPVHRPPALPLAMSMLVISILVQSTLLARGGVPPAPRRPGGAGRRRHVGASDHHRRRPHRPAGAVLRRGAPLGAAPELKATAPTSRIRRATAIRGFGGLRRRAEARPHPLPLPIPGDAPSCGTPPPRRAFRS
ncbi:hypothetical protein FOB82_10020 [Corynebacterium xerosis]|uniref:LssY-like C-terminal domain-containing protein n=1 Tax=Corynebacterium xerosis TaxID=1725 RepID=A0A6B8TPJ3_9CORY|nr:hypothetical protein FOB82_10020 [Corynebacterium xerosis]